jgi:hypothetical protein
MGALVCLSLTLCALLAGCSKTAFWSAHEFDAISAKLKSPSDWKWKLDGYRLIGESPSSAIMGEYSILFYPRLQGDMSPELAFALVAKIPITEMPELKPVSGGFGKCRALTISLPDNSARLSKDAAGAVVVNRAQHSTISAVTGKKGAYIISATVYTVEDKVADSAELINTLKTIQSELDVGCK